MKLDNSMAAFGETDCGSRNKHTALVECFVVSEALRPTFIRDSSGPGGSSKFPN